MLRNLVFGCVALVILLFGVIIFGITPEMEKNDTEPTPQKQISSFTLPIDTIITSDKIRHSIPLEEIRQGCRRQDCIPAITHPEFISGTEASSLLKPDSLGIALLYKNEARFYPFSMLVTKEIVNDIVADDPLLITYCPLCGTGIVYKRTINNKTYEFGVSGMLWQSNLLMYNREKSTENQSLWSQVLGEAVAGVNTGQILEMVPSDIMKFSDWYAIEKQGVVLNTGNTHDPYNGEYYVVAKRFLPNFNEVNSKLPPETYVYGIEYNGSFKAYPRNKISDGVIRDMIGNDIVDIKTANGITNFFVNNKLINDVEGFWFSWYAAHPETLIWTQ